MSASSRVVLIFCLSALLGWCNTASAAKVNFCGLSAVEDIILTNSQTGQVAVWCDGQATSSTILGTINLASGWRYYGVLKSASGQSDIVLYNSATQQVTVWPAGEQAAGAITGTVNIAAGWSLQRSFGDWSGDGKGDCWLFNTSTRQVAIWPSCNVAGGVVAGVVTAGWTPYFLADVNGDGQADLLLQRTSDRTLAVWPGVNPALSFIVGSPGIDWIVQATGKLYASSGGAMDLLWYNVITGELGASFGTSLSNFTVGGIQGWLQYDFMLADITGSGVAALLSYRPASGIASPARIATSPYGATVAPYNSAAGWTPASPSVFFWY